MVNVEKRKLYAGIRNKNADYTSMSFSDFIDYRTKLAPEVPLYTETDYAAKKRTEVLPGEFKQQYRAVGAWLNENGYHRDKIAIMGDNSIEWLMVMYAIVCSDNIAVPVDKGLDIHTLRELFELSDCTAVFYSVNYAEKAAALRAERGLAIYCLDEADTFVQEGKKLLEAGKNGCVDQKPDLDAPALIMFTSGTTGKSKGVVFSQRNMASCVLMDIELTQLDHSSVILLPFHHAFAMNLTTTPVYWCGKTQHIARNLRYMYQDFQIEKPELLVVVPMFLKNIYDTIWKNIRNKGIEEKVRAMIEENRRKGNVSDREKREMFSEALDVVGGRLRTVISGAAPMDIGYYNGFKDFGIELMEGYGITECSPMISANTTYENKLGSTGKILPGIEVMIDQPDKNKEGEICVRGPIVMLGYYKNEEETAKAIRDGWFHTGDLGYLDEDDRVYVTGRIKNLIILENGENVSPEELEARLNGHPAIQEDVVYDKNGRIAAQIYINKDYAAEHPSENQQESIKKYIADMNRQLPAFKQIAVIEFRETPFARTSSKKIARSSVE